MRLLPYRLRDLTRKFWFLVVLLCLLCLQFLPPVWAQERPAVSDSTAHIELDGYSLFRVWSSDQYSAAKRVEAANDVLQAAVESEQPVQVRVVERNQLPVIEVNDRYLLTVIQRDAIAGYTPQEQAQIWQRELQQAIERGQEQRQPGYLRRAFVLAGGLLLLAIAAHWGLGRLWRYAGQRLLPHQAVDPTTGQQPQSMVILAQSLLAITRFILWAAVLVYIGDLFPLSRTWSRRMIDAVTSSLTAPLFNLGERDYSLVDLVILIGLFLGLLLLTRSGKTLLQTRVLRLTGMSRGAQEAIAFVANYLMIFVGTVVLLQLWGLDLSSLTILASVLGVGLGLGLQGIAREIFSGLDLIFERPIQVGDFIEVDSLQGTVERINVRSTEIQTLDQVFIIVPNSRFLESEVINWSHRSPVSRLRVPVGVAYSSNPNVVREALIEAAIGHPDVLKSPAPKVFFQAFADNSLNFDLLVWINDPRKQYLIKSDLNFRIEAALRDREIEIPFPQHDLHVRSGKVPLEFPPQLQEALLQLSTSLALWLQSQNNGRRRESPAGTEDSHRNLHEPPQQD